jgi:plastocyanin
MRGSILALASTAVLACAGALSLPAGADTVDVAIAEYKYDPAELKIKVGTTVRWTNNEKRVSHSILFTGEGGFESERFFPGESWERTFDKPGSYPFSCGPHPEMKGLIEVTE